MNNFTLHSESFDYIPENKPVVNHLFNGRGVFIGESEHKHLKAKKVETIIQEFNTGLNMPFYVHQEKGNHNDHSAHPSMKYRQKTDINSHVLPSGGGQGLIIANKKTKF